MAVILQFPVRRKSVLRAWVDLYVAWWRMWLP